MAYRALLKPAAEATEFLSNTTLHPVYFPYPLTLCLHALRISHVYSTKVKASGHRLAPAQHLAGFLVMSWGGALWVNMLLCHPPPQLYSPTPWIIYCTTHIVSNIIVNYTPLSWPSAIVMDSIFAPIDAICRSGAIIGALSAVTNHPNPAVANSLLAQIIIGAVSSVGGGAAAGFFGVWDKEWSLKTPAFLKGGIIPTMDVWAGSLAAILYGIATFSNPSYASINTYLVGKPAPFMTPLGARSLVVVFLTFMYTIRVVSTHFVPKGNPAAVRSSSVGTATPSSKRAIKPMPVGKEKKVQ